MNKINAIKLYKVLSRKVKNIIGIIKSFWSKYKQRELEKVNRVRKKYNCILLFIFWLNTSKEIE